jgi:hypothetical protein
MIAHPRTVEYVCYYLAQTPRGSSLRSGAQSRLPNRMAIWKFSSDAVWPVRSAPMRSGALAKSHGDLEI